MRWLILALPLWADLALHIWRQAFPSNTSPDCSAQGSATQSLRPRTGTAGRSRQQTSRFSYLGRKIGHLQLKLTCTSRPPFLKIGEETSTIHTSGYCGCPAQGGRKASGRAGDIAQRPRRCSTDRRQPNHFRVPCAFLGLDQALPDRRDWSRVGGEQIGPPAPQPRCAQPRSLEFRVGIHPRPFPFRPVASDLSRAERKGLIWRRFIESHRIFDKHVDRMQSQQKILPTSKAFRGSANLQRGKSRCFRSE